LGGGRHEPSTQYLTKGYLMIKLSTGEWVLEHRHIMALTLGRPLSDDELVHHKDGDRTNNVVSNLQVMTMGQHLGHHKAEYWKHWRIAHGRPALKEVTG